MNMEMKFAAVVVVYNKSCADSLTCRALEQMALEDVCVTVFDNSTSDFSNKTYCEEKGWVFLGGNGNLGISKAYNACIDRLLSDGFEGMICLFDDDTQLSKEYFELLKQSVSQNDSRIFVPLIFAGGKLISPCLLEKGHKVVLIEEAEQALNYNGEALSAINSCMAVSTDIFKDFRYDENIFLDGVDHNFVVEMRKKGEKLKVFPFRCEHMFSGVEKPPMASALNRFKIYAKDYGYILKADRLSYLKLVGKRAISLCIKYKTPIFLRYL